jgi:hypothetical protein
MPWELTGNPDADIDPFTSFLGTIGPDPLRIKTNSAVHAPDVVTITSAPSNVDAGYVGIGADGLSGRTPPRTPLHVVTSQQDFRFRTTTIHTSGSTAGYSFNSRDVGGITFSSRAGMRWEWFADNVGQLGRVAQLWTGEPKLFVTFGGQLLLNGGFVGGRDLNVPVSVPLVAPVPGELVLGGVRTSIRGFDGGADDPNRPDSSPIRLGNHFIRTNGNESELWMAFGRSRTVSPPGQLFRQLQAAVRWVGPSFDKPVPATPLDARLKTNVSQVEGTLEKLERIRGVAFEWAEAESPFALGGVPGQLSLGVVAQEVEEVFPEVVSIYDPDQEYRAVDYNGLTCVLIEAVKELKAQNEALRSRIEALEGA